MYAQAEKEPRTEGPSELYREAPFVLKKMAEGGIFSVIDWLLCDFLDVIILLILILWVSQRKVCIVLSEYSKVKIWFEWHFDDIFSISFLSCRTRGFGVRWCVQEVRALWLLRHVTFVLPWFDVKSLSELLDVVGVRVPHHLGRKISHWSGLWSADWTEPPWIPANQKRISF